MKMQQIIPELIVDNIKELVSFYVEKFEFKIEATDPETDDYSWVQLANGNNKIMMQATEATKAEIPGLANRVTGTDLIMIKLENMEAVRKVYSRFTKDSIYMDIRVTEYGSCEFGANDPEGRFLIISGD